MLNNITELRLKRLARKIKYVMTHRTLPVKRVSDWCAHKSYVMTYATMRNGDWLVSRSRTQMAYANGFRVTMFTCTV